MLLNNKLLIGTSVAALLVIGGVVAKNSFEQMDGDNKIGGMVGMIMFVLGWIATAWFLSKNKKYKFVFILASIGVLASVMAMKMMKKKDITVIFPIIFSLSWLVLGFMTSNHLKGVMKFSGLIASALVLVSMLLILPAQRKKCIVDGPGLVLFTVAWMILVVINSARTIKK